MGPVREVMCEIGGRLLGPCNAGHATVAVVTFPLQLLASALDERAEAWSRLAMYWRTVPAQPNHGKPVVRAELESAAWLGSDHDLEHR